MCSLFHSYWTIVLTPDWFKNAVYIDFIDLVLTWKNFQYVSLKTL